MPRTQRRFLLLSLLKISSVHFVARRKNDKKRQKSHKNGFLVCSPPILAGKVNSLKQLRHKDSNIKVKIIGAKVKLKTTITTSKWARLNFPIQGKCHLSRFAQSHLEFQESPKTWRELRKGHWICQSNYVGLLQNFQRGFVVEKEPDEGHADCDTGAARPPSLQSPPRGSLSGLIFRRRELWQFK